MRHLGPPTAINPPTNTPHRRRYRRNLQRRAHRVAALLMDYVTWGAPSGDPEDRATPMGAAWHWYDDALASLRKEYGKDYRLAIGLIAATSPQSDVKSNMHFARIAYDAHCSGTLDKWTPALPSHENNVYRAIDDKPLSGHKVEAFRLAILGDSQAIVVDTWMFRACFPRLDAKQANLSHFRVAHEAIRLVAETMGWPNRETQAVIWMAIRSTNWIARKGPGDGRMVR